MRACACFDAGVSSSGGGAMSAGSGCAAPWGEAVDVAPGQRTLPAALNSRADFPCEGGFEFDLPSKARARAEAHRDLVRNLSAGGVALLTPARFEEAWRPRCARTGDGAVGDTVEDAPANTDVVADFLEHLIEAIAAPPEADALPDRGGEDMGEGGDESADAPGPRAQPRGSDSGQDGEVAAAEQRSLIQALRSGVVESNLTVGPAMHFLAFAGLLPRILQPRFVVVLGPGCLRISTLGFVGSPELGDRPTEKRTPYVVRLLTQNLVGSTVENPTTQVRIKYWVRLAGPSETSISPVLSLEAPALLDIALGRAASFADRPLDAPEQARIIAGVAIPPARVVEGEEFTTFVVEVSPASASGSAPWCVRRRYREFHDLRAALRPGAPERLDGLAFPRRHVRGCAGARLEARRLALEAWLSEVVREAQSREPGWLRPLCDFLECP